MTGNRYRSTWTPERQGELARLAAEKKTAREIGAAMGFSKSSIIGRANRTGVILQHGYSGPQIRKPKQNKEIVFKAKISPVQQKEAVSAMVHQKIEKPPEFEPYAGAEGPFTTQTIPAGRCRWVCGEIARADTPMCGHEAYADGKPWCDYHRAIVFTAITQRKDPVKEAMRR